MDIIKDVLQQNVPPLLALVVFCFLLFQARRLSSDIVSNIGNMGFVDGWKKLAALQRALVNFYLLAALIVVIVAKYITQLDDRVFIAILVAALTSLGIKLGVDAKAKE